VGSGSGTGQQRRHGRRTVATEEEAWMVTADGEVEDGDGMGGTSALVGCKEANQREEEDKGNLVTRGWSC
jgi:hypothetical protein